MEVGVCCRQEGGAGSCRLELRQHKVSGRLSEAVGECWQAAAVTEPEHCAMLYQTRDFTESIQLCSVSATFLSPQCKPCFMKPERER